MLIIILSIMLQLAPPGCWVDPGGDVVRCPIVQIFLPIVPVDAPVIIGVITPESETVHE